MRVRVGCAFEQGLYITIIELSCPSSVGTVPLIELAYRYLQRSVHTTPGTVSAKPSRARAASPERHPHMCT